MYSNINGQSLLNGQVGSTVVSVIIIIIYNNNINDNNDLEVAHPQSGSSFTRILIELEFGNVGF